MKRPLAVRVCSSLGILCLLFPLLSLAQQTAPKDLAPAQTVPVPPASDKDPIQIPSSPAQSDNKPASPPPSAPKDTAEAGPAQAPTPPDYSQEAYVVEFYRQSMRFENDGTGRDELEARIKVVSESGVQALGQLKIGYSALSDKLDIDYVRVRKADGSVVVAQESAVQDLTIPDAPVYTDYHQKHVSVPSLRPGDVLEYHYVRNTVNPLTPGQFWTSFNFADRGIILDEELEINVPKNRQLKLKTKPGFDPKISDDGDRRIYRWTHSRLNDDDEEAAAKKKKKTKRKRSREEDEIPSVELTTFQSWEELGAWYASLERDRRFPDAAVKSKADQLVAGKTTDMDKVKALYDYVSRNFRYVSLSLGLARYQPHAASEVLSNGYGDCKDKNTLLASLLQAEGFQSTSVLIGSQHKLDPDVPSPSQFDHVITRVPVDGKEIWLDSTNGVAPFRMLSANLRNKQALAVSLDGKAVLVWTPTELPFETYDRTNLDASINDTGKFTGHVSMTVRGDSELVMRFTLRQLPSNKWKDFFEFVIRRSGMNNAEVTNVKVGDPTNPDTPLQIDFDMSVSNYFDWSAPEAKFTVPLTMITLPDVDDDDSNPSPKPIKLGDTHDAQIVVKLGIPEKYSVRAPIGIDVKRDYAEYHSSYKYEAGALTSDRTLKLLAREVPYARLADYSAFRRAVGADEAQQILLENKAPGSGGVGANESADDLNDSAMQALHNDHYELAVDLFQRTLKLKPDHKTAWENLGLAYLSLNQNDRAIEAFKKQIALNAYDEFAYTYLGVAYQREQKYDDAIQQFQKQIEINPLDQRAHANLGTLYSSQKKFADALPELQKATDIDPKNPLLQVSLGEAYVATGETVKGMAAFEKAISIAPSPVIWNNIAYALSEQNVQLDRADKYIDAAISAVGTQLRDVGLDNLRTQDLGTTNLLFGMWDTKGWIAFKRGDLDAAEQWILPAWLASGRGDEAQHLGEIYEKRGKRDEAVRYYIDSLAVESPGTEARARLTALGVKKDIDRKVADAKSELARQNTIPLDHQAKGAADFFLLVAPGRVEQAKFIKGDSDLKGTSEMLQKTNVRMEFPKDSQVHVPRRASVVCGTVTKDGSKPANGKDEAATTDSASPGTTGPCVLELKPADSVRGLD